MKIRVLCALAVSGLVLSGCLKFTSTIDEHKEVLLSPKAGVWLEKVTRSEVGNGLGSSQISAVLHSGPLCAVVAPPGLFRLEQVHWEEVDGRVTLHLKLMKLLDVHAGPLPEMIGEVSVKYEVVPYPK